MNVIFLTVSRINDIGSRGIYTDLMRKFRDEGHNVYIVTPYERQFGHSTSIKEIDGVHILGVKTLNVQKTNVIEKGISTILLEYQFKKAIKKFLFNVSFDLILYSTPPITFTNVIRYLKNKNLSAVSYLLLKDIFPQNAVDLGMFTKKSPFYWYFRKKEAKLYKNSDYIGCMSPANVEFVLENNKFISPSRVEVAPNSIDLNETTCIFEKAIIRTKYNLPINKTVYIYGGNLGKPQGIEFLIKCLDANKDRTDCYFLIVGNGTEYSKLESWYKKSNPQNMSLFSRIPKKDYDNLVRACDIGLIFLDNRFTIPNYPSRLLSYLECKMPIIAATDINTDIGYIAQSNGYGFWCESNNVQAFTACIEKFQNKPELVSSMGNVGYNYLKKNYLVDNTYEIIVAHLNE